MSGNSSSTNRRQYVLSQPCTHSHIAYLRSWVILPLKPAVSICSEELVFVPKICQVQVERCLLEQEAHLREDIKADLTTNGVHQVQVRKLFPQDAHKLLPAGHIKLSCTLYMQDCSVGYPARSMFSYCTKA